MAAERPRAGGRGVPEREAATRGEEAAPDSGVGPEAGAVVSVVTLPGRGGSPDLRVVELVGDVNNRALPQVESALAQLEGDPGEPAAPAAAVPVVDLTRVRYLDDRAVRALFALADRSAAAGRTLHVVAGAGSESERVARIMQLETFVAVHDTLDEVAGIDSAR